MATRTNKKKFSMQIEEILNLLNMWEGDGEALWVLGLDSKIEAINNEEKRGRVQLDMRTPTIR